MNTLQFIISVIGAFLAETFLVAFLFAVLGFCSFQKLMKEFEE